MARTRARVRDRIREQLRSARRLQRCRRRTLVAAITACPAGAGIAASNTGATVTVTDTTPGPSSTLSVGATGNTGIFTWSGTVNPGTNGNEFLPKLDDGDVCHEARARRTWRRILAAAMTACPATVGVSATRPAANGDGQGASAGIKRKQHHAGSDERGRHLRLGRRDDRRRKRHAERHELYMVEWRGGRERGSAGG